MGGRWFLLCVVDARGAARRTNDARVRARVLHDGSTQRERVLAFLVAELCAAVLPCCRGSRSRLTLGLLGYRFSNLLLDACARQQASINVVCLSVYWCVYLLTRQHTRARMKIDVFVWMCICIYTYVDFGCSACDAYSTRGANQPPPPDSTVVVRPHM